MNETRKLTPGNLLQNRYRVESILGQGGFGAVYQAYDTRLNKMVAVKETVPQDPTFLRQFEREAQLLARLQHTALPAVTDYFTESSVYYLVMSYIPGEDLSTYLEHQPGRCLSEPDALAIIAPVLDALEYLHTQQPPIIHRDIKPDNVRLDPDGKVYLVDFGLAKAYTPSMKTTIGARALTPGFAPIEQYGAGTTNPRSDLYAVGAMLYVMLSGTQDLPEAPDRLVSDTLVPLRQRNPAISPEMEQVVIRLLAIQPQDRYPDVETVRQALLSVPLAPSELVQRGATKPQTRPQTGPTLALPQSITRMLPRSKSFWSVSSVIGGLLVIAAIMTAFVVAIGFGGDSLRSAARTPTATATLLQASPLQTMTPLPTQTPHVVYMPPPLPQLSPYYPPPERYYPSRIEPIPTPTPAPPLELADLSGRLIFQDFPQDTWDIYTMRPDGTDLLQLTDKTANDLNPSWSPDGSEVVFESDRNGNSDIYRIPATGGEPHNLTNHDAYDTSPVWSPDGEHIAFISDRHDYTFHLYVMDADGSNVRQLTRQQVRDAAMPTWSPDGTRIAFVTTTYQGGTDIYSLEVKHGSVINITQNPAHIDTAPDWSPDGKRIVFQSNREGNDEIFVKNIERGFSGLDNLTEHSAGDSNPCWSPDGEYIIFQSDRDSSTTLYIMRADGTQPTRLTNLPEFGDGIDWGGDSNEFPR